MPLSHIEHCLVVADDIDQSAKHAGNPALYPLFMIDPNGIKIELIFDAAEAEGLERGAIATNFTRD